MPQKILLVDDDLAAIRLMAKLLAGLGEIQFATSGPDALRLARQSPPTVILLDADMPDMSGMEVCRALKADPLTADAPVIFVTSHTDMDMELAGFEVGAADFIAKPVRPALVQARVRTQLRLAQLTQELRRVACTDALTQVANRGRLDELLDIEWRRCCRAGKPLSMMMIDVDHFKLYNDHYGHQAGDECLMRIAQALRGVCQRPGDLPGRYGGEEFALLMPATARAGAMHMASRVLEAVGALRIAHGASPTAEHVTVSIGIASYDEQSTDWPTNPTHTRLAEDSPAPVDVGRLVGAADQALYAAKTAGRGRAYFADLGDAGRSAPRPVAV